MGTVHLTILRAAPLFLTLPSLLMQDLLMLFPLAFAFGGDDDDDDDMDLDEAEESTNTPDEDSDGEDDNEKKLQNLGDDDDA